MLSQWSVEYICSSFNGALIRGPIWLFHIFAIIYVKHFFVNSGFHWGRGFISSGYDQGIVVSLARNSRDRSDGKIGGTSEKPRASQGCRWDWKLAGHLLFFVKTFSWSLLSALNNRQNSETLMLWFSWTNWKCRECLTCLNAHDLTHLLLLGLVVVLCYLFGLSFSFTVLFKYNCATVLVFFF